MAPPLRRYQGLLQALAEHRDIEAAGGWAQVENGEMLGAGVRSRRVMQLRERLTDSGDLEAGAHMGSVDPERFDVELEWAIRRFQQRHGIAVDGRVGSQTLNALNMPVEGRIAQLRVNLERLRWMFRDFAPRQVVANIPGFHVALIEDDEVRWQGRAVVGRPSAATPPFHGKMTHLEFNPTWTVPPGMIRREVLPELRRGLDVLAERELFDASLRAFSAGCVRIERPLELAWQVLTGDGWDAAAIERVFAEDQPTAVDLARPLPVLMTYATAVVENGSLQFLPDIYGRDAAVMAALDQPYQPRVRRFTAAAAPLTLATTP